MSRASDSSASNRAWTVELRMCLLVWRDGEKDGESRSDWLAVGRTMAPAASPPSAAVAPEAAAGSARFRLADESSSTPSAHHRARHRYSVVTAVVETAAP